MKKASAYANANIALVKYWGKSDHQKNIPAVSSLSMTLDALGTTVSLDLSCDQFHSLTINDRIIAGAELTRLNDYLEAVRRSYRFDGFFKISSQSSVPIAAGLASSAAFFAALSLTLNQSLELNLNAQNLSILARLGSASAARSIFGAFVGLHGGPITHEEAFAFPLENSLDLALLVAVVSIEKKALSSRAAMNMTEDSSPFFPTFVASHGPDFSGAIEALKQSSFPRLGEIMEHSTLKMHASMWAAKPAINYLHPATLALMNLIYDIRKKHGPIAYFTMDAGPNVKVFCETTNISLVKKIIIDSGLASELIESKPGPGAHAL